MPFYRVGPARRKKPTLKRRPGWDDSVNDLTVYRATPEEIFLRKEAHKSKNHVSVKLEKLRKERQKAKMSGAEATQLAIMKEVLYDQHELQKVLAKSDTMMAVVKDLFGDDPKRFEGFPNITTAPDSSASDVNRSGSLVASVPDIYTRSEKLSDSVMHQSALNDLASESDSDSEEDGEVARPNPISYQSQLNLQRFQDFLQAEELKLSSDPPSMVSQLKRQEEQKAKQKLLANSVHPGKVGSEFVKEDKHKGQMKQLLDLLVNDQGLEASQGSQTGQSSAAESDDRQKGQMRELLSELLVGGKGTSSSQAAGTESRMLNALLEAMAGKRKEPSGMKTPPNQVLSPRLPSEITPPSAMNDTKKLKKTKKCTKAPESLSSSMNTSATMNGMRQALKELEAEITAYEHQTGRRTQQENGTTETFSGYTIALVSAVAKLTKYLKETDLRVRTEVTIREQLTQDVYQLRTIIDALATDIILTQEEYSKLYSEHQRYKESTSSTLASVNNELSQLRLLVTGQNLEATAGKQRITPPLQQQPPHLNLSNNSKKTDDSRTSTPLRQHQDSSTPSGSGSYRPLPSEMRPTESMAAATAAVVSSSAAAIMLSPPVRKTRVPHSSASNNPPAFSKPTERQSSLVDVPEPPHLTQTPPVMNSVSVPRPIPLVQTNMMIPLPSSGNQCQTQEAARVGNVKAISHLQQPSLQPLGQCSDHSAAVSQQQKAGKALSSDQHHQGDVRNTTAEQQGGGQAKVASIPSAALPGPDLSDLVKMGNETEQQLQRLQELAVEEAMSNPALQELMQTQIAELNRQQEEARQRLLHLLDKQKSQQTRMQMHFQDPQTGGGGQPMSQRAAVKQPRPQVSPAISPIPQSTEGDSQLSQGKGIVVSLPLVDLDVSDGSVGSPLAVAAQFVK